MPRNSVYRLSRWRFPSFALLSTTAFLFNIASPVIAQTTNAVWDGTGATAMWNDTANWAGGSKPASGATTVIHFAGSTQTASVNDYVPFSVASQIVFDSGASSFTLSGNSVKLKTGIQNNTSVLQTVNLSGLTLAPVTSGGIIQLNPTSGDLTINTPGGSVLLNNNAQVEVFGSNTLTINSAIQDGASSSGKFMVMGPATVVFNGANTYTGGTVVDNGSLQFGSNGSATGILKLGNTTGTDSASIYARPNTGGVTIANDITVRSGSSGTMTIGGLNTSGTSTYGGTVTLNRDVNLQAATGGTVTFNTLTSPNTVSTATVSGGGTVVFGGTADNNQVGAVVNSGTLLLNKSSTSAVHAVGSGLTVNNGGTVIFGNNTGDQIYQNSFVTINNGGTLKTGGFSEGSTSAGATTGMGAFTLQGGAIIDFGVGANGSTLSAASGLINGAGAISILNWSGTGFADNGSATNDRLLFQTDPGFSATQLAQFQFFNDGGNALGSGAMEIALNGWTELVPIPEASTWVSAALSAIALVAFSARRKVFRRTRTAPAR